MDIISVQNLIKTFDGFTAVNDISFSVPRGDIFAFLGPNGAGKTTTIKMLTTLLEPTSGSIMIDGNNIKTDKHDVRRSFGIIFQDQSLDDELTAFENLEFHGVLYSVPFDMRRARIEELLKFVELWDRRDDLVKHFSGGMKRRLEIARGLIHHPRILYLDEPTIGLDPQTRNHIWGYIANLSNREGVTVFFTTHYMEEADRVARNVAVIDHGSLIAQGTAQDLKKNTGAQTLEEAFLALTGKSIRAEDASGAERMRLHRRVWKR